MTRGKRMKKNNNTKIIFYFIVYFLLFFVLIYSGIKIYEWYRDKNKNNEIAKKIKETVIVESNGKNKEEYLSLLKQRRKLDIIKGFTTKGIHRDDFVIYINNKRLDIYGSQGQHRTAILSLKLSELNIIEDEIGEKPILLLDDFMSELDEKRRNHFLEKIEKTQVIITCTDKIDIENKNILIYNVKEGKVIRGGN